jgi:hypothetical protein
MDGTAAREQRASRRPVLARSPDRGSWFLAATLAGSGIIHFSMVVLHTDTPAEAAAFAVVAWLQVGLALALALRPARRWLALGAAVNLVALGTWLVSRTAGLPFGAHAGTPEPFAVVDVTCAALEGAFVIGALALLSRDAPRNRLPDVVSAVASGAVLMLASVALLVPSGHGHEGGGGHAHGAELAAHRDDHTHGATEVAVDDEHDDDHDHGPGAATAKQASTSASGLDDHPHDDESAHAPSTRRTTTTAHQHDGVHDPGPAGPSAAPHNHGGGPAGTDPGQTHDPNHHHATTTTAPQKSPQEEADEIVRVTRAALVRYENVAAAEAAGYSSLEPWARDDVGAIEHWVNPQHFASPGTFDPTAIESLVYRVGPNRTLTLVAGMYMTPLGTTMADIPDVGTGVIHWHDHGNLCFGDESGNVVITGTTDSGACPAGSINVPTPPMVHVWRYDTPCGPFAVDDQATPTSCPEHGGHTH